jgi:HEPN domain-containing protein
MSGRAADWFRQAEADLHHAQRALADGAYEWACFAAQQAAEKAAKATHAALGQEAWGHVVTELLDALRPHEPAIDEAHLHFCQLRTFRAAQRHRGWVLVVSALSVSGAIFLILEMYAPYSGLIEVSKGPLRAALVHLGQ